jgi:hypothetical protein
MKTCHYYTEVLHIIVARQALLQFGIDVQFRTVPVVF